METVRRRFKSPFADLCSTVFICGFESFFQWRSAMTKIEPSRWPAGARISVLAIISLSFVGLLVDTLRISSAEAQALSPQSLAGFQTTDKLLVNVTLSNPDEKELKGTLRLEMRGP